MRFALLTTLLFSLFSASTPLFSQCANLITDDRVLDGTHILKTTTQTLVVRGKYSYSISLQSGTRGITARMFSKAGVEFNQDDEIIFMDVNQQRRSYRFIDIGEMKREGVTPVYHNLLQLDMAAIEWFEKGNITTIYIKNNISTGRFSDPIPLHFFDTVRKVD